jgi:hypothetical protein
VVWVGLAPDWTVHVHVRCRMGRGMEKLDASIESRLEGSGDGRGQGKSAVWRLLCHPACQGPVGLVNSMTSVGDGEQLCFGL